MLAIPPITARMSRATLSLLLAKGATMRRAMAGLVVMGLWLGLCAVASSQAEWKTLTSKSGRFTILMPGEAKEQTQDVPTPVGKITMTMYILEVGGTAYFATY